jgi:hypothetical protein
MNENDAGSRGSPLPVSPEMVIASQKISKCGIGGDSDLEMIFALPQLPLTEAFGPYDSKFPSYDQELVVSKESGHVQLRFQLDPAALYSTDTYGFRSGNGAKSRTELQVLQEFVSSCLNGQSLGHVLEIGGNDLTLAKIMRPQAASFTVCDPLLSSDDGSEVEGIGIVGTLVEEAIESNRFKPTDLLIARHTLEHITNPSKTLQAIMQMSAKDCLYVFEVPSLQHLVEAQRFDAVFHQHYHYFDLDSVRRLIWEVGGEYVDHQYNYQGSNGGSLLFAFRRGDRSVSPPTIDVSAKVSWLKERINLFTRQMDMAGTLLDKLPGPVFGFGAGHMLSTLDYHLGHRLDRLVCVLDDDPKKDGFEYRNVNVAVRSTSAFSPPEQSSYIVTSMENIRPIYQRIQSLNPRRILVPQIS